MPRCAAFEKAIQNAGGVRALADATGINLNTVNTMRARGRVTRRHIQAVARAGGVAPWEFDAEMYRPLPQHDTDFHVDPASPLGRLVETISHMAVAPTLALRLDLLLRARTLAAELTQAEPA